MKSCILLFCVFLAVSLASCTDFGSADACENSECYSTYPTTGTLTVKIKTDGLNSFVPVRIYAGRYDSGQLLIEDTLYYNRQEFVVDPGEYYTVAATYQTENGEVVVVDGGKIDVITNNCDSFSCYTVTDVTVNCKLKYDH